MSDDLTDEDLDEIAQLYAGERPCSLVAEIRRLRAELVAARIALANIANRWGDNTKHSRQHGEDCNFVVCVAKRALATPEARENLRALIQRRNDSLAKLKEVLDVI